MIQPTAGSSAAVNVPTPQPQPAQVTKMSTANAIAISGWGARAYWKLPIRPCNGAEQNSTG